MKIKDPATGNEIEVFTQEDLDKKAEEIKAEATKTAEESVGKTVEEKMEEFKKNNPDKSEELTKLQDKIKELETAAEGEGEGEGDETKGQVKRLLGKIEDLTKTVETLQTSQQETHERVVGDTKGDLLKRLSGGDDELSKKIELEFDSYKADKTTKEDIIERMAIAYKIVEGKEPSPSLLNNVTNPGAGENQEHKPDPKKIEYSDNAKEIGTVLGITDEDRKNYQEKVNKTN